MDDDCTCANYASLADGHLGQYDRIHADVRPGLYGGMISANLEVIWEMSVYILIMGQDHITMREEEAKQIGNWLAELDSQSISPCVNLGSSAQQHRQSQTHTQIYIWRPLQQCGVKVLHADIRDAEGVDIVGDIFDERTQQRIREIKPKLIFCCNMLEHVEEPGRLAQICADCLSSGGKLIVSVPCSYPYHADPIDTMFRPSTDEVAGLFPSLHVVRSQIVTDISMWQTMRRYHSWTWIAKFLAKSAVIALPFMVIRGVQRWKNQYHMFLWFFRPYRITCLLLEKPLTANDPVRTLRRRIASGQEQIFWVTNPCD